MNFKVWCFSIRVDNQTTNGDLADEAYRGDSEVQMLGKTSLDTLYKYVDYATALMMCLLRRL